MKKIAKLWSKLLGYEIKRVGINRFQDPRVAYTTYPGVMFFVMLALTYHDGFGFGADCTDATCRAQRCVVPPFPRDKL